MKLVVYSTVPFAGVGYGTITRALIPRMIADGHEVKLATKHHLGGQLLVDGIECFDGREIGLVNKIVEEGGYDYLISIMDHWVLPLSFSKWVCVCLLDQAFIYPKFIENLKGSLVQVACTEHGKSELERAGFRPEYAPFGVDTKLFRPDPKVREEFRKKKGWSNDTFVAGLVGINYISDRKNIVGLLRAFQGFHKTYPNSILYLHTDIMGSGTQGRPLAWVMEACGFDGEGRGAVRFVDQRAYHLWDISQEEVAGLYNAFDVMCLPSMGEGFGLPWIEAQACGCPVIATDTTSGKQLCLSGWLIPVHEDDYQFSPLLTWNAAVPPSAIYRKLELAHRAWTSGKIEGYRKRARKRALAYDWDTVYAKHWRPLLASLEEKKQEIVQIPNYPQIYQPFTGRILMADCAKICQRPEICAKTFPLLEGESNAERSVLSRSYPIAPNRDGQLLSVSTECPLFSWLSPRFVRECATTWKTLFTYPKVRRSVEQLWDSGYFDSWGTLIPLDRIERSFNGAYRDAMQTHYRTTFELTEEVLNLIPPGGSVLDVGAGDGRRVRELHSKKYYAVGTEINEVWINNATVVFGDAEALPFEDNSFDAVLCIDVLEHLQNPLKAVSELLRVSRGLVIAQITTLEDRTFYEDPTHCVPWSIEQWRRELSEFGRVTAHSNFGFVLRKEEA